MSDSSAYKVQTTSRLAQWRIENFSSTYRKSDHFKIGKWNWHLSVEKNRALFVRLYPEISNFTRDNPPIASFVIRVVSSVGDRKAFTHPHVLVKKFKEAKSNLEILQKLGASTFHGVDATKMKFHSDLKMQKFDRIIFNFPHAGFYGKEDNVLLIKMHMDLVEGFFRNANGMLRPSGEEHVTHKTSFPYSEWKIEELARRNFLELVECVDFKREDYPGYNNKIGDNNRCDEAFSVRQSCTFKFRFSRAPKNMSKEMTRSQGSDYEWYIVL